MKFKVEIGLVLISLTVVMISCATISLAQSLQPKLLYEDNFSTSKNSLFVDYDKTNNSDYFYKGKFRMTVAPVNHWSTYTMGNNSSDIIIEVEASQVSGPNDNAYGVFFRSNSKGYYMFVISGDGYYQYNKAMNRSWLPVRYHMWSPIKWVKSSAIHTGNATNLIKVSCKGNEFSFYINDIKVDTITDTDISIPSGRIGLIVGTCQTRGTVKIDFDNLKVWENS